MTSRQATGDTGRRRSLAARILVGATAAVGGVLLLALAYFSIEQRAALDRVFEKQNQSLTDSLAAFSIEQLIAFDYPALEYAISVANRQNDSILFIEVEHSGRTVASSGRKEAVGHEFIAPISRNEADGAAIGRVRMVFSTHDHDLLKAAALRNDLAIMLLIFAVMIVSLRWLLRRTVIVPIEQLTLRTEQAIAEALPELAAAGRPEAADEVQLLDQRFRSMLDGLKRRDAARDQAEKALVDHQENLERLVDERTHELRLAREEADRLNQVKSEFLAAASHDLRQPLQAIALFHAVLRKTRLNDEQARIVNWLSLSLASLGDLLNALLDVSKLDAGRVKPVLATLPAVDLLQRIDAEFAPLAAAKGLRFKLFFPLSPQKAIVLDTDASLLLSMLSNLVGNAIKYTERGGILVSVRQRGGQALVQVWDTGIGIDGDDVAKIYDEYFQVGNAQRDRTKGLGLGLSIVRRLVTLLGSSIDCRSRPGRGSVFSFMLPLASGAAIPAPSVSNLRPPIVPADAMRGATVILVEDDPALTSALQATFAAHGIDVRTFASAEAALAEHGVETADYFLSDFRLPGIDGIQMLGILQQRAGRRLNAVVLTGDTSPERIRAAEASSWPVFFKPVDFDSVLAAWYSHRPPATAVA